MQSRDADDQSHYLGSPPNSNKRTCIQILGFSHYVAPVALVQRTNEQV